MLRSTGSIPPQPVVVPAAPAQIVGNVENQISNVELHDAESGNVVPTIIGVSNQ